MSWHWKGLSWDTSYQELTMSRGWAIFAGFCTIVMVLLYISSWF